MPKRSSTKKPKEDFNQAAFRIVRELTEEKKPDAPKGDLSTALDSAEVRKEIMREMGRRGGERGGKARAEKLSADQRKAIAKAAAQKRWNKDVG